MRSFRIKSHNDDDVAAVRKYAKWFGRFEKEWKGKLNLLLNRVNPWAAVACQRRFIDRPTKVARWRVGKAVGGAHDVYVVDIGYEGGRIYCCMAGDWCL